MTTNKTVRTWDVFRDENRAGGSSEHVGTTQAPDGEAAQWNAEREFECRPTQHLHVTLSVADGGIA